MKKCGIFGKSSVKSVLEKNIRSNTWNNIYKKICTLFLATALTLGSFITPNFLALPSKQAFAASWQQVERSFVCIDEETQIRYTFEKYPDHLTEVALTKLEFASPDLLPEIIDLTSIDFSGPSFPQGGVLVAIECKFPLLPEKVKNIFLPKSIRALNPKSVASFCQFAEARGKQIPPELNAIKQAFKKPVEVIDDRQEDQRGLAEFRERILGLERENAVFQGQFSELRQQNEELIRQNREMFRHLDQMRRELDQVHQQAEQANADFARIHAEFDQLRGELEQVRREAAQAAALAASRPVNNLFSLPILEDQDADSLFVASKTDDIVDLYPKNIVDFRYC